MSTDKLISASYIFDMVIKGFIAIVVTVGGYHFKEVTEDIKELKSQNTSKETRIAVIESAIPSLSKQIDRIEIKLDKALERK